MTLFLISVWLYVNAGGNDDDKKNTSTNQVYSEIEKMEELFQQYDRMFQTFASERKKVMDQLQVLANLKKEEVTADPKVEESTTKVHEDPRNAVKPQENSTRKSSSKTVLSREECIENLKMLHNIWKSNDKKKLLAESLKINDKHQLSTINNPIYLQNVRAAEVDANALDILTQCFPTIKEEGAYPINVLDDGNCCYNSVSFLLYGTEERAMEIRLFTAVYFIIHEKEIQVVVNNNLNRWGRLINDSMWTEMGRTLGIGTWSNALTMENIARACNITIYSMYPYVYVNGKRKTERTVSQRLTGFHGSDPSNKKIVNILWTGTSDLDADNWHVNHLVPIVFPKPEQMLNKTISVPSTRPVIKKNHEPSQQPVTIHATKPTSQKNLESVKIDEKFLSLTKAVDPQSDKKTEKKPDTEVSDDALTADSDDDVGDSAINFAYYRFTKVVNCMLRRIKTRRARDKLPRGPKANKRFVTQNLRNQKITDGLLNKIRRYHDDTGPKQHVNTCYSYYEEKENGEILPLGDKVKRHSDGTYYNKHWVALENQPKEDTVFRVKFTYHTTYKMADKKNFVLINGKKQIISQRRTIEVFQAPERYSELVGNCFIEFKGDNPTPRRHGNAIGLERDFIAVPPETREGAIEFGKDHKPEDIMGQKEYFDPNNLLESLRDMKAAEYARSAGLKAKNPGMSTGPNEANWFFAIHNALRTNPYVESVIDRPSAFQSPIVIMGKNDSY